MVYLVYPDNLWSTKSLLSLLKIFLKSTSSIKTTKGLFSLLKVYLV